METLPDTQHRVSAPEREHAISRLQEAYIRGQLSEDELGSASTARLPPRSRLT
jgi:hypothetical protein